MIHIASIVHGNDFMILLPLAELRDLEVFLRCGFEANDNDTRKETQVYDFDKEFPGLTPSILQDALFKELFQIASALVWLHEEIRVQGSLNQYCAHMDLKPDNILIRRDHRSSVGKWMISDFGISIFDKRTDQMDLRVQSIRDVGRRLTSRAREDLVHRGQGPYQPPEVDAPNVDGRKCDVWSFGCIVSDILKFSLEKSATEGKRALERFRRERWYGGDDYFYKTKTGLNSGQGVRNKSNTELKETISYWLNSLSSNPPHLWVKDCVTMLRKVLVIDPDSRMKTKAFMEALDSFSSSMASEVEVRSISIPKNTLECHPSSDQTSDPESVLAGPSSHPSVCNEVSSNLTLRVGLPPPDDPQYYLNGWPDHPPMVRIQTLDPQVKKSLPNQGRIKNVAFSFNGDRVALLFKDSVHVHATDDSRLQFSLPSDAEWRDICIASPYFAVYGIQRPGLKSVNDPHIEKIST